MLQGETIVAAHDVEQTAPASLAPIGLNDVIESTLRHNLEMAMEDSPHSFVINPDLRSGATLASNAKLDCAEPTPIVFGFRPNESIDSGNKVAMMWEPLFDRAESEHFSTADWQHAFHKFRQSTTAIALTRAAWRDCQLVPVKSLRQSFLPPLIFPERAQDNRRILLINHGADSGVVAQIKYVLAVEGFETILWSRHDALANAQRDNSGADLLAPAIHVHLGPHTVFGHPVRIIDSWNNRRCVIQYADLKSEQRCDRDDAIRVENGVNGISTGSVDELASALRLIRQDEALRQRIISISMLKSRQLTRRWQSEIKAILE